MKVTIEAKTFKGLLIACERAIYEKALQSCHYNQSLAARMLGVSRGTLRTKLVKFFGDKYVTSR